MTVSEIKLIQDDPSIPFPIEQISFYKKILFINNKVALKVDNISSYFNFTRDITIKNEAGVEIGVLTFTKDNPNILEPNTKRILLSALNHDQFIAFLSESDDSLSYSNFNYNYIVIKRKYLKDYFNLYKNSSSLWGGFTHPNELINIPFKKNIEEIIAIKNLVIPPKHFYHNCIRAIQQTFAFERFLKFYHLLELSFDSLIVEKIKNIDLLNDTNRIGRILNEYDQKEIKRLTYLLKDKCVDSLKFAPILNSIRFYEDTAINLLYDFGNEENPIKNKTNYLAISRNQMFGDESYLRSNKVSINDDRNIETFLIQTVSYIIYRVRCSIAHNKIGEYIFKQTDEEFIVEFAEPLLKEVLKQCFKI